MSDWKFLGRYAVSTYPENAYREYVVVKKNVIGYAELAENNIWNYYHFAPQEKGTSVAPEPIFKASGTTAEDAVEKGMQ